MRERRVKKAAASEPMNSLTIGLLSACCIFTGALVGLWLNKLLPRHHLSEESQNTIKLGAGMIATLTALVLGLLVSSAKSAFDTVNAGVRQGAAKVVLLDRVLSQYGPEAAKTRAQLKESLATGIANIWPDRPISPEARAENFEHAQGMEPILADLHELNPQTGAQRQFLAEAWQLANELAQLRLQMIEDTENSLPMAFLVVLLGWLMILFASFGLFAPRNGTVVGALFVCALSASAAIFLILEMSHPLTGMIQVSKQPLLRAQALLGG